MCARNMMFQQCTEPGSVYTENHIQNPNNAKMVSQSPRIPEKIQKELN